MMKQCGNCAAWCGPSNDAQRALRDFWTPQEVPVNCGSAWFRLFDPRNKQAAGRSVGQNARRQKRAGVMGVESRHKNPATFVRLVVSDFEDGRGD